MLILIVSFTEKVLIYTRIFILQFLFSGNEKTSAMGGGDDRSSNSKEVFNATALVNYINEITSFLLQPPFVVVVVREIFKSYPTRR